MSIRLRLTLWYVLLLCLGLFVFAAIILWQNERLTSDSLDETLRQRAAAVADDLVLTPAVHLRAGAVDESSRQLGEVALRVLVLDTRGRVVVRQGPPVPGRIGNNLADLRPGLHEDAAPGDGHFRVLVVAVPTRGPRRATIQVLTTTHQLEETRFHLLVAMATAGALIVIAAAAGGKVLADRALLPIDRIIRLAAAIGAGDLHRRISAEAWGTQRVPGRPRRPDELGRLVETLDGMLARLQEAGERRRQFTADAAHELATPVATIVSGAEIALRRPRSVDEYRAALHHALQEGRHVGRIVDDLVLLARADAGQLPLQRELVEVDGVCREAARAFEPLAAERQVLLTTTMPSQPSLVIGDDLRIGQVVRNLLDNAIRHTPVGGTVHLQLQEDDGRAGHPLGGTALVRLSVRDTGTGIPAGEEERVFDRFHRASGGGAAAAHESRRAGSSGLGLAICRAIVDAHGGRIWIEPPVGGQEGAEVVVELPGVLREAAETEGE